MSTEQKVYTNPFDSETGTAIEWGNRLNITKRGFITRVHRWGKHDTRTWKKVEAKKYKIKALKSSKTASEWAKYLEISERHFYHLLKEHGTNGGYWMRVAEKKTKKRILLSESKSQHPGVGIAGSWEQRNVKPIFREQLPYD